MTTWTKVTGDFDFLNGYFDVRHRTLKAVFEGCDEWNEFEGTTTARTHFDGAISVDEMRFPTQQRYGMSVRLFDPVEKQWSIWWIDSRTMQLYPPVHGGWSEDGTSCRLVGEDELDGQPILVSYEWSAIRSDRALGAVLLQRRREDLGAQLGHGLHPAGHATAGARRTEADW
jgi:hypothetical protein